MKEGEKAAGVSILVSLLLSIAKAVVGHFAGSVVLVTDAVHSGADSLTGFASWVGLKISQRKPTEKFPYGYYKAENLATLLVSAFIFYAGIGLLRDGYSKLFAPPELSRPYEALAVALISSVASYFLSAYMKRVGERTNSQSLIANAKERRVDILSSLVVFVSLLLTFYNIPYVEGVVTIFISLLALKVGFDVAKDSVYVLMDESPSKSIERKIMGVLEENQGIESFDELKLRKSGPLVFGEVKVKIRKNVDVKRAHEIADKIEKQIKEEVADIESFTIHVEPYRTEKEKIVIPVKNKKGLKSDVMGHFGRSKYFIFVVWNRKEGEVESHYFKENPYVDEKARAGYRAAEFISGEKIDALVIEDIGGISFHAMRDNLVDIYKTDGKTVEKVLKKYEKEKLEKIEKPTKELGEISEKLGKSKEESEDEAGRGRGRRGRRGRGGSWWKF